MWFFGTGAWQWVFWFYVFPTILIYARTLWLIKKEQGTFSPTRNGKGRPKVLLLALFDVSKWPLFLLFYGLSGLAQTLR